ncbi:hypothetical protein RBB77_01730 [Tunturibacter psychrotolerans]|uniref:Uncharacterized protein n=1 Tax=Tunturiibacter psychrotolerans TaxID=3069686 RepID=A0AAU7ZRQ9_9BACT
MLLLAGPMSICHACGDDLRAALPLTIPILDQKSFLETVEFLKSLESNHRGSFRFGFSFHAILHQQCRLILSERAAPGFREFIRERLNCPDVHLVSGRSSFETRTIVERHQVLGMAMWIMSDLQKRLKLAWESRAVKYNALLKDLDSPPQRFVSFARQFNRSRTKGT